MEFGVRLKELRQQRGLTQADLASLLELKPTAISNYEANRNQPSFEKLIQLSEYFEVSSDYLLGLSDKFLPVVGEIIDKDIIDFFHLYQQMDQDSIAEIKGFAEYLIYKQNKCTS